MKTVLTIAGSDSSGGAGIQADIKTMTAHGVFSTSCITALTAQNTIGVKNILEVSPEFLAAQIDCVFTDIPPDAVKTGMLSNASLIRVIADRLNLYEAKNIVTDPVMISTSGFRLIDKEAIEMLLTKIFPISRVITPNIPEAEVLSGIRIISASDMLNAAESISKKSSCAVLCKGGHNINDANDLLYDNGNYRWFEGEKINNPNTHGTGCTLSSAIASNLALGCNLEEAVFLAKKYISGALGAMLDLGSGSGPLDHSWNLKRVDI